LISFSAGELAQQTSRQRPLSTSGRCNDCLEEFPGNRETRHVRRCREKRVDNPLGR